VTGVKTCALPISQEIIDMPEEDLLAFLAQKSRNRISDLSKTSELVRKAARDSYRLDKCMYEPLNISLASSFNCIQAYQKEIRLIEQAIDKCIKGMNTYALIILQSIPGIGPRSEERRVGKECRHRIELQS